MNDTLSKIFIFAAGVVIGSAVSWKIVKNKYEQISREEIDSVRSMYEEKHKKHEELNVSEQITEGPNKEDKVDYAEIVQNYKKGGSESMEIGTQPYVISYDEFGDIDEYDAISLTFYSDGVVADDWGEVIEDITNTIGDEFSRHYDEDENDPDIVYVRNDRLKSDYEISRDIRKFSEVNLTDEEYE